MYRKYNKHQRRAWWASLTPEQRAVHIARKKEKQPYKFPPGTELELTPEVKARVTENMKRIGMERYMVW